MDYNALKVTELKDQLKKRGIPTTKLTRKQEIINALEEDDQKNGANEDGGDAAPAEEQDTETEAGSDQPDVGDDSDLQDTTRTETAEEATEENMIQNDNVPSMIPAPEVTGSEGHGEEIAGVRGDSEAREMEQDLLSRGGKEVVEPFAQPAPEGSSTTTVEVPENVTVNTIDPSASATPAVEEMAEESRKRKRRSPTPPVREESVSKKLKSSDGNVVHTANDQAVADAPVPVNTEALDDVEMEDNTEDKPDVKVLPMATSDDLMEVSNSAADRLPTSPQKTRSPNERRYANLLNNRAGTDAETTDLPETAHPDGDEHVAVSPAMHPATRALYIRDLVRPLNPSALKDQLRTYATPPDMSDSSRQDIIETFHLDALRTHAFVLFGTISMASRARGRIHGHVWPPEPTRKPLWADFIPEEKVQEWIDVEMSRGGARPSQARRWEAAYEVSDDGNVNVELVEAGAAPVNGGHRGSTGPGVAGAPTGPRGGLGGLPPAGNRRPSEQYSEPVSRNPPPRRSSPPHPGLQELELDKLFRFTSSKPKIYYMPVPQELVDKRLDELDRQTARGWDPREDARLNPGRVWAGAWIN
ncbi:hypothetical protein H2203_006296 [Taxawa tesnikishii (nom. ined.)]|nr:hypothetical protein H2203_006296 [Dothideales sp. JES 119]